MRGPRHAWPSSKQNADNESLVSNNAASGFPPVNMYTCVYIVCPYTHAAKRNMDLRANKRNVYAYTDEPLPTHVLRTSSCR